MSIPKTALGYLDVVVDDHDLNPDVTAHRCRSTTLRVPTGETGWDGEIKVDRDGKPLTAVRQVVSPACQPAPTSLPSEVYTLRSAACAVEKGAVACPDKKCFPDKARR